MEVAGGRARPGAIRDRKPKALTQAELGLLLTAIPGEWRLFFEVLTQSGLRIGEENIGLTWEHVELGDLGRAC